MGINIRSKGQSGEREFCKWLQKTLKLEELPSRNLDQVRCGGADVLGVIPFVFEIKRCETLSLKSWWKQVVTAAFYPEDIPVVAYRQNRKKWKFLISSVYVGVPGSFIQLEEEVFKKWLKNHYVKTP